MVRRLVHASDSLCISHVSQVGADGDGPPPRAHRLPWGRAARLGDLTLTPTLTLALALGVVQPGSMI